MSLQQQTLAVRPAHLHRPERPGDRCHCGRPWTKANARKTGIRDEPAKRWRLVCECGAVRLVGGT